MKKKLTKKKKWTKPSLKSLKFNQTLGGSSVGIAEGTKYIGTFYAS